jgi:hypothetical protein
MKPQDLGTRMPVETHSDLASFYVVGMGDSPKGRNDANGKPKFAPNGEMTYGSGCIVRMVTKDGTIRNDKSASVHVTKPATIYELGQIYQAQGRIWVQPYESNGRVALSITVEALVPVKADAPGKAAA